MPLGSDEMSDDDDYNRSVKKNSTASVAIANFDLPLQNNWHEPILQILHLYYSSTWYWFRYDDDDDGDDHIRSGTM